VKRHGFLDEEDDFADFVNYCIILTMSKVFGARVGVARALLELPRSYHLRRTSSNPSWSWT